MPDFWEEAERRRREREAMVAGVKTKPEMPWSSWWKLDLPEIGSTALSSTASMASNLGRFFSTFSRDPGAGDLLAQDLDPIAERFAPEDDRPFLERFKERPLQASLRGVAGAAPSLVPVVGGALFAGPPGAAAMAAATSGPSAAVDSYDRAIELGADKKTALAIGAGVGSLTAILDSIGGKAQGKILEAGIFGSAKTAAAKGASRNLAKQILAGTAVEVTTEESQELVAMMGELAAGRPLTEILDEAPDRLAEVGVGSLGLSLGLGGVSTVGQKRLATRGRQMSEDPRVRAEKLAGMERALGNLAAQPDEILARLVQSADDLYREQQEATSPGDRWGRLKSLTLEEREITEDMQKAVPEISKNFYRFNAEVFSESNLITKVLKNLASQGLVPEKTAREWEVMDSERRRISQQANMILDFPVLRSDGTVKAESVNQTYAPALRVRKDLLAADPEPEAIYEYLDDVEAQAPQDVRALLKPLAKGQAAAGRWLHPSVANSMRKLWTENPGMKAVEEIRWILRQEEIQRTDERKFAAAVADWAARKKAFVDQQAEAQVALPRRRRRDDPTLVDPDRLALAPAPPGQERLRDIVARMYTDKAAAEAGRPNKASRPERRRLAPPSGPLDPVGGTEGSVAQLVDPGPEPTRETWDGWRTQGAINEQIARRHDFFKSLPEYGELVEVAKKLSGYDRMFLELDLATGRISEEQYRDMLRDGEHYAPIYDVDYEEFGPRHLPLGDLVEVQPAQPYPYLTQGLAKGARLVPPTVATIRKAQGTMRRAAKQQNINQFRRLVEQFPAVFQKEGIYLDKKPKNAELPEGLRNRNMKLVQIDAFEDGNAKPMVMPEVWARALEVLPANSQDYVLGGIEKAMALASSLTRTTAIFNPGFQAMNIPRNEFAKLWLSRREVFDRPFFEFFKAIGQMAMGSERFEAWQAFGVGQNAVMSSDIHRAAASLEDVALSFDAQHADRMKDWVGKVLQRGLKVWKGEVSAASWEHLPPALLQPIGKLGEILDTAGRIGSAQRALESGLTPAEAVEAGNRSYLDFKKASRQGRFMNRFYPFWTARARDLITTWENVAERGLPNMLLRTVVPALVIPEMVHFLLHADDDEYDARPEWEKRMNYFLWKNSDGTWAKIPRPLGWISNLFGYGLGQMLRWSYREDANADTLSTTAGRIYAALSDDVPFVGDVGGIVNFDAEGRVFPDFGRMAPEGIKLPAELWANRKAFFNSPIVPPWMKTRPPEERAYRSTPKLYVDIAKVIPGTDEPLVVQHIAETMIGSIGTRTVRVGEAARKVMAGEETDLYDVPLLRAFIAKRSDAPSLAPVRQLFDLVGGREAKWAWKRSKPKGSKERMEFDFLNDRLTKVRELIELRNSADQLAAFDARNNIDAQILELANDSLRTLGQRGTPGEGPLGEFWDTVRGKK